MQYDIMGASEKGLVGVTTVINKQMYRREAYLSYGTEFSNIYPVFKFRQKLYFVNAPNIRLSSESQTSCFCRSLLLDTQ
jgi:hypothetical protein